PACDQPSTTSRLRLAREAGPPGLALELDSEPPSRTERRVSASWGNASTLGVWPSTDPVRTVSPMCAAAQRENIEGKGGAAWPPFRMSLRMPPLTGGVGRYFS